MSAGHTKLKPQHAPKAPHEDPEFLESTPARPLRILAEYLHPLAQLKKEGIADTIVMFGSARIEPRDIAQARVTRLKNESVKKLSAANKAKHRADVRHAKSLLEMSQYYEEARELSHKITSWSLTLGPKPRRFVICSGGGPGIMEAANRGAIEAGGKSIGLSIELPHEQFANAYISPELSFNFHYFFMRKLWFAQIAKALVVFPGGFGTMDELWEMLTLLQTGKLAKHNIIVIYGRKYWDKVLNWQAMVNWGTINEDEYKMLQFADSVDEAFDLATVASEIIVRIYLTIGFTTLTGLVVLAVTSTNGWQRRLGPRRWQRLHYIIYGLALLAVIHFCLQSKLDEWEPTVMAGIYLWLMGCRAVTWRLGRGKLPLWAMMSVSIAATALTALGEAFYFWIAMGAPFGLVVAADFSLDTGVRPAWIVLVSTAAVALVGAARNLVKPPRKTRLKPA